MTTFIALLRGINVGGNKKVEMAKLRVVLEKAGFANVKTLLNSGNVVFGASSSDAKVVRSKLESIIEQSFGFPVPTIVRTADELKKIAATVPFKKFTVTKDTRLYVTFLSEKPTSKLKIPYTSPDKSFTILKVAGMEVLSALTVSAKMGTVDAMSILEKEFGKNVTTRNWNTVEKLLATQ